MNKQRKIYSKNISDIALEISISSFWRKRIFNLPQNAVLVISANDKETIPEYVRDVIVNNRLTICVEVVDECEAEFDEDLIIFKFFSMEYPDITSYSGNNPKVI